MLDPDCVTRPLVEWSSWLGLGARASPDPLRGAVDLSAGAEAMFPASSTGAFRIGPWVQLATGNLASLEPTAGVELLLGGLKAPWIPLLPGSREGAFGLRLGGGWRLSAPASGWQTGSGPLLSATLTWGVRTFTRTVNSNNVYGWCTGPAPTAPQPGERPEVWGHHGHGYSWGLRAFLSARTGLDGPADWQLGAGVEIEPMSIGRLLQAWRLAREYHREPHPRDRERPDIPPVSSGRCGDTPVSPPSAALAEGATVALEGTPEGRMFCTLLGCDFECCGNECGYQQDCAYALPSGEQNEVCLSHPRFECGGSDCSPYCAPFGLSPAHRYRFVGTVRKRGGSTTLEVSSYCRVD